ncbi:permease [Leucobacter sp. CSA1]|uniref:Permease n=1 Tax=Leucobacter chromiisoli TaxID=2796471 RepID=A0A934UU50_9MICO|nr:FtsX-like permease family protein [Leucobacter chromiisoli]MBK0417813.1 permease [Leucobacter chromiisoli]
MSALRLLVLPRRGSSVLAWLQLSASAVATLLAFAATLLAAAFWRVPTEEAGYRVLAIGLVSVLLVPLVTLGAATARLAARSRDDRLATLRLLGASARRVRGIAVAEAALLAGGGVLLGTAAALLVLPVALGALSVHGERLGAQQVWLPWWGAAAIPPALVAIAALSALLGLRRVVLSPLGVRTRQDAPRMGRMRLIAGLLVVGGAVLVTQLASPGWGVAALVIAFSLAVLAVMGVLGVVGPFVIAAVARARIARTDDPARLVAARGVLDDPKAAWRQVSAVALTSFILLPAGSLLGYLEAISASASRTIMTPDQLLLFVDARTMLVALVAIAFVVVACQIGITQTAAVLERRELYVALDRLGMPRAALDRARRLRVGMPAVVAIAGSALAATALAGMLVAVAAVTAPLFVAGSALLLVLGFAMIRIGVAATAPTVRRVLDAPGRGE